MKMIYNIQALTPIFSYGADPFNQAGKGRDQVTHEGTPEIRPASIRGQLRRWMEWLGYGHSVEPIFGSTAGDQGTASKVMIRVDSIQGKIGTRRCTQQHHGSKKTCYLAGTRFQLILQERLGGLSEGHRAQLQQTIEAWLLMGTLGGRGTRAAGSLQNIDQTQTESEWSQRCAELLANGPVQLFLGQTGFQYETEAREAICDTLAEKAFPHGSQPLGGIKPRKTSPLKMRVVHFADADPQKPYHIAALWTAANVAQASSLSHTERKPEAPSTIDARSTGSLQQAIQILKKGNGRGGDSKAIGAELENAIRIA